jgi:adenylyltransferase/sulfurtransferase
MTFTEEQIQRYSRHILLPDVGGKGQMKIRKAKVFAVGAGGLGSPAAYYLAAAGVGTIGIADGDVVDLSNLQRQILHHTKDVGRPKVESAAAKLTAINPDVTVKTYRANLTSENVLSLIEEYDLVLDGSDNFATRYLMSDACFFQKKTLISGSIFRFDGQVTTLKPQAGTPCYRCLYPEPPPPGMVPSCQEAGVLGVLAGTVGVLMATEAIKEILGIGTGLEERLLIYDALEMRVREVRTRKDPNCPLCGPTPKITQLLDYERSCTI